MITDIGEMTALTSASPEYVGFDEFVEYQDLWFRDRVGDDKGDHRWMADEPEWWPPLLGNISCAMIVLIELCSWSRVFGPYTRIR